jgi:hypothetical protein
MRDPSLSAPITLHDFRIIFFDLKTNIWSEREAGRGITRISKGAFEKTLDEICNATSSDNNDGMRSNLFTKTLQKARPAMPVEADETASRLTLEDLNFTNGDILDCVIGKQPSSSSNSRR